MSSLFDAKMVEKHARMTEISYLDNKFDTFWILVSVLNEFQDTKVCVLNFCHFRQLCLQSATQLTTLIIVGELNGSLYDTTCIMLQRDLTQSRVRVVQ